MHNIVILYLELNRIFLIILGKKCMSELNTIHYA